MRNSSLFAAVVLARAVPREVPQRAREPVGEAADLAPRLERGEPRVLHEVVGRAALEDQPARQPSQGFDRQLVEGLVVAVQGGLRIQWSVRRESIHTRCAFAPVERRSEEETRRRAGPRSRS